MYKIDIDEITSAVQEFADELGLDVNAEIVDMFIGIDEVKHPGFNRRLTRNAAIDAG